MKKGGYKIIDFKGTALSGTAVEMPDIYGQIVDDYDKPIMVSGVILNGELQDDAYASVKVNDGSVALTVYGGVITVTDDDEVSFAVLKTNAELAAEIGDLDDLETTDKDSVVSAINEVKSKTESIMYNLDEDVNCNILGSLIFADKIGLLYIKQPKTALTYNVAYNFTLPVNNINRVNCEFVGNSRTYYLYVEGSTGILTCKTNTVPEDGRPTIHVNIPINRS